MKELHPVQQQLLDKFGTAEQIKKLSEEILELGIECQSIGYWQSPIDEKFYREFLDVRNLMQQIESKLDPILLEKYEAEMFEKAKKKYLDKGV